ncbi:MAG: hypothetical protein V7L23_29925 [Nostoc sp.]|uniref:hypothetical protein n=1 Tax=Nostoc sp. TaxID=1180 RepID=UPI002FEE9AE2
MSVDSKYGLKTISRASLLRQLIVSGTLITIPFPVIVAPTTLTITQNEDLKELEDVSCLGENVVAFTYIQGFKPEISLEFSVGAPEIDAFIHGRILAPATNVNGFVYFESIMNSNAIAPRVTGTAGYEVVAQTANANPEIYYIDPATKLARQVAIVTTTPTGDQITIGAHLAITLSDALAATGATIRGWIPCTFASSVIITSQLLDVVTVKAMGIDFNGNFAGFQARNCSRLPAGQIGTDPKREVKLRILPDPNDGTGLGYQMYYTTQQLAC